VYRNDKTCTSVCRKPEFSCTMNDVFTLLAQMMNDSTSKLQYKEESVTIIKDYYDYIFIDPNVILKIQLYKRDDVQRTTCLKTLHYKNKNTDFIVLKNTYKSIVMLLSLLCYYFHVVELIDPIHIMLHAPFFINHDTSIPNSAKLLMDYSTVRNALPRITLSHVFDLYSLVETHILNDVTHPSSFLNKPLISQYMYNPYDILSILYTFLDREIKESLLFVFESDDENDIIQYGNYVVYTPSLTPMNVSSFDVLIKRKYNFYDFFRLYFKLFEKNIFQFIKDPLFHEKIETVQLTYKEYFNSVNDSLIEYNKVCLSLNTNAKYTNDIEKNKDMYQNHGNVQEKRYVCLLDNDNVCFKALDDEILTKYDVHITEIPNESLQNIYDETISNVLTRLNTQDEFNDLLYTYFLRLLSFEVVQTLSVIGPLPTTKAKLLPKKPSVIKPRPSTTKSPLPKISPSKTKPLPKTSPKPQKPAPRKKTSLLPPPPPKK